MLHPKAREKLDYQEKLKRKYAHMPQVRRIAKHRHVPLFILNAKKKKRVMFAAAKIKHQRMVLHRKPGSVQEKTPKESVVIGQEE